MLKLLEQNAVVDLLVYVVLLLLFHRCVYRKPFACILIGIAALGKVVHTCGVDSDAFKISFNLVLFGCLLLGLFFARKSPNYLWLFSGMLFIKCIDLSIFEWALGQGVWFYAIAIVGDALILLLLDQRSNFVSLLAKYGKGEVQRWAEAAQPYQRVAYQDVLLMVIYWVYVITSVFSLFEKMIRDHTDYFPTLIYTLYPYIKLPLNLFELIILFNIVTGHAICLYRRERVW